MIRRIAALLLGMLSSAQSESAQASSTVSGDNDVWMVYERVAGDGQPLIVLTRTGNGAVKIGLQSGFLTVVNCFADSTSINDRAMPQNIDRIYAVEDLLSQQNGLLSAGGLHIASVTGHGKRAMYYVHIRPFDFNDVVSKIKIDGFSCSAAPVEDRNYIVELVTPTPLEFQLNGDQSVIDQLNKAGDDGALARKTDFWFYGKKSALDQLVGYLKPEGFLIDHWLKDPLGIVLTREMPVNSPSFQFITPMLVNASQKFGIGYDGWETLTVQQANNRSTSNKNN